MTSESRVTIDKLDVDNYPYWKRKIKFLLISKKLWAAIEPATETSQKPETRSASSETAATASEKSMEALAIIGLHVADHLLREVDEADSARQLWDKFESTFAARSNARLLQLKQELINLKLEGKEAIQQYVARAKGLMSDLKAIGSSVEESEVALHVLQSLPTSYNVTVEVLSLSDDLTLDGILPKLLQTEQRGEREPAVPIYGTKLDKRKCHYCGKPGHLQASCRVKIADERIKRDEMRGRKLPQRTVAF